MFTKINETFQYLGKIIRFSITFNENLAIFQNSMKILIFREKWPKGKKKIKMVEGSREVEPQS